MIDRFWFWYVVLAVPTTIVALLWGWLWLS